MHILSILLSAVIFAGVWYLRVRAAKNAAEQLYDAAGHLKDKINRRRVLSRLKDSNIRSISDPRVAATVVAVAIIEHEQPMSENARAVLLEQLSLVTGLPDPASEVEFAESVVQDAIDLHALNERMSPTFMEKLNSEQRKELIDLIKLVVSADGAPALSQVEAIGDLERRFLQAG